MKTFIKWSGNKSKHLKKIAHHFPKIYDTYIEPFVGSGAVFLYLQPKKWIICDQNKDLVNVWKQIVFSNEALQIYLNKLGNMIERTSTKELKLILCRSLTRKIDTIPFDTKRAAMYLAMKNIVYMGILLRHSNYYFRGFDMSFYRATQPYFASSTFQNNLRNVHNYLTSTKYKKIIHGDYKDALRNAKEGDFVFIDPPYNEDKKYDFKYNINDNSPSIDEILEQVKLLDVKRVKWLMTQADTPKVRKIFKDYNISSFQVFRRQSKTHTNELIIKNYI